MWLYVGLFAAFVVIVIVCVIALEYTPAKEFLKEEEILEEQRKAHIRADKERVARESEMFDNVERFRNDIDHHR